jgi:hypothetical protein
VTRPVVRLYVGEEKIVPAIATLEYRQQKNQAAHLRREPFVVGQTYNNGCAHRTVGYDPLSDVLWLDVVRGVGPIWTKLSWTFPGS